MVKDTCNTFKWDIWYNVHFAASPPTEGREFSAKEDFYDKLSLVIDAVTKAKGDTVIVRCHCYMWGWL